MIKSLLIVGLGSFVGYVATSLIVGLALTALGYWIVK